MRWAAVLLGVSACYSAPDRLCKPGDLCRQLVIANPGSSALMGVPLLVELDATQIDYAAVADPTTDLRFHDWSTDQDLPFEIDRWVPGGVSDLWVRVPELAGPGPNLSTTLYYGADAHGAPNPAAVWSDFELVSHLGPAFTNSVGATYAPSKLNIMAAEGKIGAAAQLTGTGTETIDFSGSEALFAGWPTFTLELWVWPDYASRADLGNEPGIYQKQGTIDGGRLFDNGTDPVFQADLSFNNPSTEYLSTSVTLRDWNYLVYTYDNNVLQLYANGELAAMEPKPSHASTTTTTFPFFLGNDGNGMRGQLDELRISRQPRSADWILEQQRSAQRQLITFAPGS